MGGCEFFDRTIDQFRPEQWPYKTYDESSQNDGDQQDIWFHGGADSALGLTKYRSIKEADRFSAYSTDDSCSTTDSAYDSASVVSSQSSYTPVGTDTTDITLEDDVSELKHVFQTSTDVREAQNKIAEQAEWLSGLGPRPSTQPNVPLTKQNIETLQRIDAWRKERHPHNSYEKHSADGVRPSLEGASGSTIGSKCHRRRSVSQTSDAAPPCKLKRDTDSADCFVTLLIIFATRLITAIWPLSASPPMMSSCFNGAGVLPLRVFIQETLRRSKTSYSTLQVALFYLVLLKGKLSDNDFTKEQPSAPNGQATSGERSPCRAMQCGRRMFLAALMLASKYLQDRNYSTRAWSKISGLRSTEINENETEYLKCIDYNLHIPKEAFENWSKIVLTLSKLSKLQAGFQSSSPQSIPKPGSGMDSILAEMASDASGQKLAGGPEIYSDEWWSSLITRLEPDLVKDSHKTDTFLRDNVPLDEVAELLNRLEHGLPSTPGSQTSSHAYNPDMTFSEALQTRSSQAKPATPIIQTPAASPLRSAALPLRPQPRNLPTPQSTPKVSEACPWLQSTKSFNPTLRCSASLDALRSMRKQCLLNANLERCPPPSRRPHSLVLPPVGTLMRPAESKPQCPSSLATPSTSSPTSSVTSECTVRTMRSRSSSISSNSSWSSWASGPPRTLKLNADSAQFSSPLSKVCSTPDERPSTTFSNSSELPQRTTSDKTSPLTSFSMSCGKMQASISSQRMEFLRSARSNYDEGYGSGEEPIGKTRSQQQLQSPGAFNAVEALMALSSQNGFTSCHGGQLKGVSGIQQHQITPSPTRGHKRTISRANDTLQEHVKQSLKLPGTADEVIEDPNPTTHMLQSEREWQAPTKPWAAARKPVSNSLDNKRLALHCAVQQYASAADLASQYLLLQDHMLTA